MKARTYLGRAAIRGEPCRACPANSVGWCRGLPPEAKAEVATLATRVPFSAGAAIFEQGTATSHVYTVLDGTTRITKVLSDGRQASMGFRFSGNMIGFSTAGTHDFGAEAVDRSVVCCIERRRLDTLMSRHPGLVRRMLDLMARDLSSAQDRSVEISCCGAEERVESFFRSLADEQRRRGQDGPAFDLPMTRMDIGEALGLTMESVSRAVSTLRRRGVIALDGPGSFEFPHGTGGKTGGLAA